MTLLAKVKNHFVGSFDQIAKAAFMTDEHGRRIFCPLGFWSRPYVIPDAVTEATLFKRHSSFTQWTWGPMFLVQIFAVSYWPAYNSRAEVFFGFLVVLSVLFLVAGRLTHRATLSRLQRVGRRLSFRQFHANMAAQHSTHQIALRLCFSLGLMTFGYWYSLHPDALGDVPAPSIIWGCVLMMGICALAWSYTLALKLMNPTVEAPRQQ